MSDACETPLLDLLKDIPTTARLVIDSEDGLGTHYIPVGTYIRRVEKILRRYEDTLSKIAIGGSELPFMTALEMWGHASVALFAAKEIE